MLHGQGNLPCTQAAAAWQVFTVAGAAAAAAAGLPGLAFVPAGLQGNMRKPAAAPRPEASTHLPTALSVRCSVTSTGSSFQLYAGHVREGTVSMALMAAMHRGSYPSRLAPQ